MANTFKKSFMVTESRVDLEGSDKVILPESVFKNFVDIVTRRNQRVCLQLYNPVSSKRTVCGVLEYSAKNEEICLPKWMASFLGVDYGDILIATYNELPKLVFAQFDVMEESVGLDDFCDIRTILQETLRGYTALAENTVVCITYDAKQYPLTVLKIEPCAGKFAAGTIYDTDLAVDIVSKEAPRIGRLFVNDSVEESLKKGEFRYYLIETKNNNFEIELNSSDADVDLYISKTAKKPSSLQCDECKNDSAMPKKFANVMYSSPFYISVHSYYNDAEYTLTVNDASHFGEIKDNTTAAPPNSVECRNCLEYVSKNHIDVHKSHCNRLFEKCGFPNCAKVVKIKEKDRHNHCGPCKEVVVNPAKHRELFHRPIVCECNVVLDDAKSYFKHRKEECGREKIVCRFCSIACQRATYKTHIHTCLHKTRSCPHCDKTFKNIKFLTHLAVAHNINPCSGSQDEKADYASIDPTKLKIDFSDLADPRSLSSFKCPFCRQYVPAAVSFGAHVDACRSLE